MGLLGILLALALLMWLAFRGWSVLLVAPAAALLAAAISGEPILAHWTQTFMGGTSRFVAQWFPLFLLGGLFCKLMDDSGSISSIAHFLTERLGTRRAMLSVVLASAVPLCISLPLLATIADPVLLTAALLMFGGALGALGAITLGYLFYKGTIRLDLRQFFMITGVLVIAFAAYLIMGGLHELGEAGGGEILEAGSSGTLSGVTVESGSEIVILASGTTTSATVNSGGIEIVSAAGHATSDTIGTGGSESVFGSVTLAMVSGGSQTVFSGGESYIATVLSGGAITVSSGGEVGHARLAVVSHRAAELLELDLLARHRLDHLGPRDEHVGGPLDHEDEVGHGR